MEERARANQINCPVFAKPSGPRCQTQPRFVTVPGVGTEGNLKTGSEAVGHVSGVPLFLFIYLASPRSFPLGGKQSLVPK